MTKYLGLLLAILMVLSPLNVAFSHETKTKTEKMSPELLKKLDGLGPNDSVDVYIILYDVDHDQVMNSFKDRFPDEYNEYTKAKNSDTGYGRRVLADDNPDYDESGYLDPINGDLLQCAIEQKRELYSEEYTNNNNAFLNDYNITEHLFVSRFAPLIVVSVSKGKLKLLEEDNRIYSLDLFENLKAEEELILANNQSYAAKVRDYYGNKGAGVKIGQIEPGVPDLNFPGLSNASITCYSNYYGTTTHASRVARIMVGQNDGIAPQADLYCTDFNNLLSFYTGIEWLIECGVNIINMSAGFTSGNPSSPTAVGKYNTCCKWVDHIAIQHDVHFVKSAGNRGPTEDNPYGDSYITCPGMAYNVITVGGLDDSNSSDVSDAVISDFSSYKEQDMSDRAEKPNLVAAATNIAVGNTTDSGTSFAAPQVSGVIAQLCSYESSLKTKQSIMGAILAAGSTCKVTGNNPGSNGGKFINYAINEQISNKEGAGRLNADEARKIIKNGKYWKKTIYANSFPYTQNVYISSANNTLIRVAIFWLKRNSLSSSDHTNTSMTEPAFSNLDLKVYAPDGSLIDTSEADWSNFEIVQFEPTQTGYYQIVISKTGTNTSTKEYVGIAVW